MKKLRDIAVARSGDKGKDANIGVIALTDAHYHFLKDALTEEKVHAYFSSLGVTKTTRYELPHLFAFNFVLENILEEGGSASLRIDAQGKALGESLLEMVL